jgi:TM2 domain-containing membrane protein YozV
MSSEYSDKSRLVTLLLASLLGIFGAHRFYTGRTKSGILMAATLGGLGVWYLYDIIVVAAGGFQDAEGRLVANWEFEPEFHASLSQEVLQELEALRAEVGELHERVDFTERLLANPERNEVRNREK